MYQNQLLNTYRVIQPFLSQLVNDSIPCAIKPHRRCILLTV